MTFLWVDFIRFKAGNLNVEIIEIIWNMFDTIWIALP